MERTKVACLRPVLVFFCAWAALMAGLPVLAKTGSGSARAKNFASAGGANASSRKLVHASWYGTDFHGRRAANGRKFNANEYTAAHRSLRFGTKLEVTNPRNGKKVVVEVTDRGPYVRGRELDLSYAAARELGIVRSGVARLEVKVLDERAPRGDSLKVLVVASAMEGSRGVWPRAIVR
ncbi:MAG: septal ring lytic transglycosylase RlpA family protein [Candidatus Binatia bacterium]|nr:septal ring lytic transglycosylase RlpA family protein [Candidatus Binatia bacterium]